MNKDKYIKGTYKIIQESKKEKKPYFVRVLNKKFIVLPGVFSPKYFNDTELFAKHLPMRKDQDVLEIGPGAGVISVFFALKGAKKVLAIDINPKAIKNTKENIKLHKLENKIEVRKGNLYSPIKKGEKFDTIFWNTPFGFITKRKLSNLEKAVYDPNYKSIEKFIKESKKYLKKDGKLFMGFSSTLGEMELIKKFIKEAGMGFRKIFEADSLEVYPVKFEIFEAKIK